MPLQRYGAFGHGSPPPTLNGEIERSVAALAEARRLVGDDRYSSIGRLQAVESWGVLKIQALVEATYFAGLRKAGVPEE
jgi:hypothetical protein